MPAWWSASAPDFLATPDSAILERLALEERRRHRLGEAPQLRAWSETLPLLRAALSGLPDRDGARLLLEFEIPRLGGRADAILLTRRAILVLEFKIGATHHEAAALAQTEDYAIDLRDFHAASRMRHIVPILVATDAASVPYQPPLPIAGAAPPLRANRATLGPLLATLDAAIPAPRTPPDLEAWEHARYDPVPGIVDAACRIFARHDVADIAAARADATNLTLTIGTIERLVTSARTADRKTVLFVTGIPGAGKTLCGLATAFADGRLRGSTFLTGNPSLVHVLREALVRDAVTRGAERRAVLHAMEGLIQSLPRFRDHGVGTGARPPERVIVVDEAQRSWSEAHAIRKSRDRAVPLAASEPALLLDIMARHTGFAAIVCLVGNGQEIHDGEAGLAGWSEALSTRPEWRVAASPTALDAADPVARLAAGLCHHREPDLHLKVPVRSLTHDATPAWVDAVLSGDAAAAATIARASEAPLPFRLTRDLAALRAALRHAARDRHRAGLVASSGARRLRAEGLGAELPHMDPEAVASWFLDSWTRARDVRASDALEVVATQFSIQGLELDHVGLCWDADLVRIPGRTAWRVRRFVGTAWQTTSSPERITHRLNTYRVLLTRARYGTVVWVPRGDPADPTRDPETYDRIADFLAACGTPALDRVRPRDAPTAETGLELVRARGLEPLSH